MFLFYIFQTVWFYLKISRIRCVICSKIAIQIPERLQLRRSCVFIVKFWIRCTRDFYICFQHKFVCWERKFQFLNRAERIDKHWNISRIHFHMNSPAFPIFVISRQDWRITVMKKLIHVLCSILAKCTPFTDLIKHYCDTDFLLLLLYYFHELCSRTIFSTANCDTCLRA